MTTKADVFAFAVVVCEMLSGQRPWSDVSSPMQVGFHAVCLSQCASCMLAADS